MKVHGKDVEDRFWKKVKRRSDSDCWIWTAATDSCGYGRFGINGENRTAHRVSYELSKGSISGGKEIAHSCDNPSCVNPSHLYSASHAENMNDSKIRKRYPDRRGSLHPVSKLKDSDIYRMRELRSTGATLREIAKKFEVSHACVGDILNGKRWGHL